MLKWNQKSSDVKFKNFRRVTRMEFFSIGISICSHDCFIMHRSHLNKLDRYISSMHRVDSRYFLICHLRNVGRSHPTFPSGDLSKASKDRFLCICVGNIHIYTRYVQRNVEMETGSNFCKTSVRL